MREILFRGKRLDNGEWVFGDLLHNGIDYETAICNRENQTKYVTGVDPETVGQFTGLTDKNGKQIFEGDECRVSRPCVLAYGKITFQNGCFWFADDGEGGMLRLCDAKINGFKIEVIGNVTDNPELLKVEER